TRDDDPLGGERRLQLVAPERRLRGGQVERGGPDRVERLVRRPAVAAEHRGARGHLLLQARHADHEELVEDRRDDPAELDPLEERLLAVGGQLEHPADQVELRELAVQEGRRGDGVLELLRRRHTYGKHLRTPVNGGCPFGERARVPGRSVCFARHAERSRPRRPRDSRRDRPGRHRLRLLAAAREIAARVLPGAHRGLEPPPREARDRRLPGRPRLLRVRVVPVGAEAPGGGVILGALISYPQAIVLGLLQGVSELFPVSSLGHSVILPRLLGWNIHQNDPYFLTFLVATHLATAIVLLLFFWRDWVRIVTGIARSLRDRQIAPEDTDARLGWLLVVGTIPAGLIGVTLQDTLRKGFAKPTEAAIFLAVNGVLLGLAELLRRRAPQVEADDDARIA